MEYTREQNPSAFWASMWGWILAVFIFAFVYVWGATLYEWLRIGDAADRAIQSYFITPQVTWVGAQKIIDFVWRQHITFPLMIGIWIALNQMEEYDRMSDAEQFSARQAAQEAKKRSV